MNNATLSGNIGKIESFEANGKTAYRATLATQESFKNKSGEWEKRAEWHNITFFHPLAQYIEKGNKVLIQGKITTRKVEKDGVVKYYTGIIVSGFNVLEIFKTEKNTITSSNSQTNAPVDTIDDEIPF